MTSDRPKWAAALGLVLSAAVLLVGCTPGDTGDTGDGDPPGTTAGPGEFAIAPTGLPTPPELKEAQGAVADVELEQCPTEDGEQQVTGVLRSSGSTATDYVIVVNWVNDESDVRGRAVVVEAQVKPGETREWSATATVAPGATQCVRNVRTGVLAASTS